MGRNRDLYFMSLFAAHNISDLRRMAKRRLPRMVFDYIDGGSDDERTLLANQNRFADYSLLHRVLVDVSEIETRTRVMGDEMAAPLILSPTAAQRLFHPREGELAVARAAARYNLAYGLSTLSSTPIETVAGAHTGPKWFQVYVWKDRDLVLQSLERARSAGFTGLILTVDLPVAGHRERDLYNHFSIPPTISLSTIGQALSRPGYLLDMALTPRIAPAQYIDMDLQGEGIMAFLNRQFDRSLTWEDVRWMKEAWSGAFAIKGIARPDDARRALDAGADAVWISNHGGRQLDTGPATIDLLPAISTAVRGQAEIILDGGIRRSTDIIKALALGADAVAVGRAYLYGLGAAGQAGVERALGLLTEGLVRDMALCGARTLAEITPDLIRTR